MFLISTRWLIANSRYDVIEVSTGQETTILTVDGKTVSGYFTGTDGERIDIKTSDGNLSLAFVDISQIITRSLHVLKGPQMEVLKE